MYLSTRTIWAAIIALAVFAVLGIAVTLYILFGHPHAPSGGTVTGIVLALAALLAYRLSLTFWPWWPCGHCGGSKIRRHPGRGRITRAHGGCLWCRGKGRHPRLGVRVLTPNRARDLRAGKPGRFG